MNRTRLRYRDGPAAALAAGAQRNIQAEGGLGPLLDRNRDGSIIDDVTSMIGRFIKPS